MFVRVNMVWAGSSVLAVHFLAIESLQQARHVSISSFCRLFSSWSGVWSAVHLCRAQQSELARNVESYGRAAHRDVGVRLHTVRVLGVDVKPMWDTLRLGQRVFWHTAFTCMLDGVSLLLCENAVTHH
jgi:hypothetical protein